MVSVSQPRLLLTGFAPFGGESVNPSTLVAQHLHDRQLAGHRVVAAQLPVVFEDAAQDLWSLVRKHHPLLVVCLGQAGGRASLCVERVALNLADAPVPDNLGQQPLDAAVVPGAPAAYFSTLPVKAMAQAIAHSGVPGEVSLSAGSFVCNHVFYSLLHQLATVRSFSAVRAGLIHLPYLDTQVARLPEPRPPALALEAMVTGVRAALRAAIEQAATNPRIIGGKLHGA